MWSNSDSEFSECSAELEAEESSVNCAVGGSVGVHPNPKPDHDSNCEACYGAHQCFMTDEFLMVAAAGKLTVSWLIRMGPASSKYVVSPGWDSIGMKGGVS